MCILLQAETGTSEISKFACGAFLGEGGGGGGAAAQTGPGRADWAGQTGAGGLECALGPKVDCYRIAIPGLQTLFSMTRLVGGGRGGGAQVEKDL